MGFSAIGVALGAVFGSTTSIVVGVVASAVVGAAIGGLASAITGGDIGKGMLFGAVGGVVTGGLFGGAIVPGQYSMAQTTGSMMAGGLEGLGQVSMVTSAELAGAGGAGAGASEFMGGILETKTMAALAPALVTGSAGLFEDPPQEDWMKTEAGNRAYWEAQAIAAKEAQAAVSSNSSDSFTDYLGLEDLKGKNQLASISAQATEDRKAITLQGEQALIEQAQEYKLSNTNAKAEYDRVLGGKQAAGKAVAGSTYTSDADYEAILAADEERGNAQQSRSALVEV